MNKAGIPLDRQSQSIFLISLDTDGTSRLLISLIESKVGYFL